MPPAQPDALEEIVVTPGEDAWRWRVDGVTTQLEGAAVNRQSADSTARFAAGAAGAFARLARRRS